MNDLDVRRTPNADLTSGGGDIAVIIELRDDTVYTITGPDGESLAALKALRGAWHAGKTGPLTIWTNNWTTVLIRCDYEDIARIEIVTGR